jgi:hypothetical protein
MRTWWILCVLAGCAADKPVTEKDDCVADPRLREMPTPVTGESVCVTTSYGPDGAAFGTTLIRFYDAHGREVRMERDSDGDGDPEGVAVSTYDDTGRPLRRTIENEDGSPPYLRIERSYDDAGRETAKANYGAPDAADPYFVVRTSYDARGRRAAVVYGMAPSPLAPEGESSETTFEYDHCGHLVREVSGEHIVEYEVTEREVRSWWTGSDGAREDEPMRHTVYDADGHLSVETAFGHERHFEAGVPVSSGPPDAPDLFQEVTDEGYVIRHRGPDGALYVSSRTVCDPRRHPSVWWDLIPRG